MLSTVYSVYYIKCTQSTRLSLYVLALVISAYSVVPLAYTLQLYIYLMTSVIVKGDACLIGTPDLLHIMSSSLALESACSYCVSANIDAAVFSCV